MIRRYAKADEDALVGVWRSASAVATPFLPAGFLLGEPDNIRNVYLPNAETWVYEDTGTVVGFISLLGDEVGAIFVEPERQGGGIGKALMDYAVSLRGHLYLDVFKENSVGRGFYDRYGFRYEQEYVHEATGHMLVRLVYAPENSKT